MIQSAKSRTTAQLLAIEGKQAEAGMTREKRLDIWAFEHVFPQGEKIPDPWVDIPGRLFCVRKGAFHPSPLALFRPAGRISPAGQPLRPRREGGFLLNYTNVFLRKNKETS